MTDGQPRSPSAKRFVRLGEIRLGATGPLRVMQAWSRLAGSPLAGRARPIGWREGVLTLSVEEPRWRAGLEAIASTLREELNSWLGSDVILEIRFQGPEPPFSGSDVAEG